MKIDDGENEGSWIKINKQIDKKGMRGDLCEIESGKEGNMITEEKDFRGNRT